MRIKFNYFFCVIILFFQVTCFGAVVQNTTQAILIPGINGLGGESFIENHIINTSRIIKVEPLLKNIDLGQKNCVKYFEEQFQNLNAATKYNHKKLFLGTSQGTAILINWASQKPIEWQNKEIGGLVLESVLGSGSSAILHTAEYMMPHLAWLTYLPFSRLWGQWVGKFWKYPCYDPFGVHAISEAQKISPKIPIIIMHHPQDKQLSINDARELYVALLKTGNKNVYLIEIEPNRPDTTSIEDIHHLDILNEDKNKQEKIAAIQAIYKKSGLPYDAAYDLSNIDLKKFQPSAKEVQSRINNTNWKNRWLRNFIDFMTFLFMFSLILFGFRRKRSRR